jgi:hypothetical protein
VKYMLIIYGNEELWNSVSPDEQQRLFEAFDAFNKKYYDTGELLGAYGVADAAATKLVRLADGQPAVTADYRIAARYATNIPERRYLERKLAGLIKPDIR